MLLLTFAAFIHRNIVFIATDESDLLSLHLEHLVSILISDARPRLKMEHRILSMVYRALHGPAPAYLSGLIISAALLPFCAPG